MRPARAFWALYNYFGGFGLFLILVIVTPLCVGMIIRQMWLVAVFGLVYGLLTARSLRFKQLAKDRQRQAIDIVNRLEASGLELKDATIEELKIIQAALK